MRMSQAETIFDRRADASASAAERVFQSVKTAIVRAELGPGQALSEAEIAKRFVVSRQPVREAFIRLEEAGLVAIRPYRGTFVRKISNEAAREGRFVREAIEVAIVRDLASATPQPDLGRLQQAIAAQRRVPRGDHHAFMVLDDAFHRTLAELASHRRAWLAVERAKAQMDRVRYLSLDHASPAPRLVAQHAAILSAVAARDPDGAEAAIRAHLAEMLTALPTLYRRHPGLFEPQVEPAVEPTPLAPRQTRRPSRVRNAVGAAGSPDTGEEHR